MAGTLAIRYPDGSDATLALDRPTIRIGSAADADLRIDATGVAPVHAEIAIDAGTCQVMKLDGTAELYVDGVALDDFVDRPLIDGTRLTLAGIQITVHLAGRATAALAATAALDLVGTQHAASVLPVATAVIPALPAPASVLPVAASVLDAAASVLPVATAVPILAPPRVVPPQDHDLLRRLLQGDRGGAGVGARRPLAAAPAVTLAASVSIVPADLVVRKLPGLATATIRVINRSALVDAFTITAEGLPVPALISPAVLQLLPLGQGIAQGEAQLTIDLPRAPASLAGTHAFQIVVTPRSALDAAVRVPAQLTVPAYSEYRFALLDPRVQPGWAGARYRVQIENRGNQQQPFALSGRDDEAALTFRFLQQPLDVAPGARAQSELRVRVAPGRLLSEPQLYPFKLSAAPLDGAAAAQNADGRLSQRAIMPLWLLRTVALLLLLSILGGIGWLGFALLPRLFPPAPQVAGVITQTPTLSPTPLLAVTREIILQTVVVTSTVVVVVPGEPIIIVPTVVVVPPPAPTPAPAPAPLPGPTQLITVTASPPRPNRIVLFAKAGEAPVQGRALITGDEYLAQDAVFCQYRELPADTTGDTTPNEPPAVQAGFTLAVRDAPDPLPAAASVAYDVSVRNDTPGRTFIGAALIARLPAGAVLDGPADGRCQVEADGSLTCALTGFETGVAQGFRFAVKLTSAGVAAASFELNAVYTEGAGPQQTLRLTTRANTTVHAAGGALPDCGYPNLPFVRDLLARRAPQTRLVQVAPAIYEPPGGAIQSYRHVLTADDGPGRLVDDLTTVVVLQRVASAVTLTLFFPGPPGNTYRVLAFDEQGQLLALTRTDQLMIPGEYTLALHGLPRPVKRVVIQNLVYGDYDASSVRSSGGVYLAVVELFFATP